MEREPGARGVDCVQLAGAIYIGCGFLDEFAPGTYSMDGGKHAERSQVVDWVEQSGRFDLVETIQAGDLLCFKMGKQIHHVGVAVSPLKFVHVYRGYSVRESLVNDPTWKKRLAAVYRPVTGEAIQQAA